jgi:carboxymethylenebutenolidase
VIEDALEIETPDGVAGAVMFRPDSGATGPGVIHLTDFRGIRDSQRDVASRLVDQGFVVLVPNVFYRAGPPPVFNFPAVMGEERTMKRFQEIVAPLTPDAIERDMAAYVDFLSVHNAVREGSLGVVGYCLSGKMALHAAAVRPRAVRAAASFHGGGLVTDTPASPHLLLPRIKAALYFGHAVEDRGMLPAAIEALNDALATWGGEYESEVYAGARHGWTMPDHVAYDAAQADRAFKKLAALFDRAIRHTAE